MRTKCRKNSCVAGAWTCVHSGGIIYILLSRYTARSVTWAVTADGKCINSTADVLATKEQSICSAGSDDDAVLPDAIWNLSARGSHSPPPPPLIMANRRPSVRPSCIYSMRSEVCAATVLETRNCFYRAALKYQRRGGARALHTTSKFTQWHELRRTGNRRRQTASTSATNSRTEGITTPAHLCSAM